VAKADLEWANGFIRVVGDPSAKAADLVRYVSDHAPDACAEYTLQVIYHLPFEDSVVYGIEAEMPVGDVI
jgi:hypothetical protein